MTTIKSQNFGVEIELTGITRETASEVIARHYGKTNTYEGGYYQVWTARDSKNRTWKCMTDGSIACRVRRNGRLVQASDAYSCEVVAPILQYDDIEDLQQIVRELVAKGAIANSSCGIHVHVDGANHTPDSLTRLLEVTSGRQDLFYEALEIGDREYRWCHKISPVLVSAMKRAQKTLPSMEQVWYSRANDNYRGGVDHSHYNQTRYHGINLHAFFTKGTVEFRLFNGTTHAGKIKAYIQFCLALSAWAITDNRERLFFKKTTNMTKEAKAKLMESFLTKRLHLSGKEYKTCRLHLTSAFM